MPNIGVPELIIVLVIVLLVVGPKKLPGFGRSLGTGMREFKDSVSGNDKDDAQIAARPADPAVHPVQPAAQPQVAAPANPLAKPDPAAPTDPPAPQHSDGD